MWLLIIVVIVLLLRAMATSKTAANINQVHKTICSSPTAGDSFTQGNTIAAGVPEPPPRYPAVHCNHIVAKVFCGIPAHVVYPVAPPPIRITQPAPAQTYKPPTYKIGPIRRPSPMLYTCGCCTTGICISGGGGGGTSRYTL